MREDRANQIVRYFKSMQDQTLAYAKDRMTVDAMRKFSAAFHGLNDEVSADVGKERDALETYISSPLAGEGDMKKP